MPELAQGTKHDQDKVRYDLLSPFFLRAVSEILTFGAQKYDEYNWAKGIKYHRLVRAVLGHILDWWEGEENDEETGKSHLWHAACCLMFLIHYEMHPGQYAEFNDRPFWPHMLAEGVEAGA